MFVKPFRYARAGSVEEATGLLRQHGPDAKVLAGGQSLIPMLNLGIVQVEAVIDIAPIEALRTIELRNGSLALGALARHRDLERSQLIRRRQPVLVEAVRHVGNARVRNRGTVGGSLAHSDPSAELPAVMAALDATYELADENETRTVPAREFPMGLFETELGESELLTSISVPALGSGWGWGFHEFARRDGDFAIVAAAAVARCEGDVVGEVRLGLAGAADRAVRCPTFEAAAVGRPVDELPGLAEAVEADIDPMSDVAAGKDYRRHLARVLSINAVTDACRMSAEESR